MSDLKPRRKPSLQSTPENVSATFSTAPVSNDNGEETSESVHLNDDQPKPKRRKLRNSTSHTTTDAMLPPNGDTPQDKTKRHTNGRQAALQRLDALMATPANLDKLDVSMQERFDEDPLAFFRTVAVPLIAKTMLEEREDDNPMRVRDELRAMDDSIATEPDEKETEDEENG